MKNRDPIVAELHNIREAMGKANDFDVRRIAASIRQHEKESRARVTRQPSKQATRQKKAS